MTIMTDKNWNQNDELRALESLITQINADIRSKKTAMAHRSRIPPSHSPDEKGLDITSVFHSSILIAACANSPVSIISQKYKMFFNT